MKLILLTLLIVISFALPDEDNVTAPGIVGQTIYSGYLPTTNSTRKIHYVFVQARSNHQDAPLVIWLNGGPGCSSLLGMFQQLGPYLIGNEYKQGENLTKNQYSWNNAANLLFLQSPAIVGFSSDKDPHFHYTDEQTADDAFAAIRDFVTVKAPQFASRPLFISGQSYAGKYIPDITVRIIENNRHTSSHYIHLQGILVGNGVMNFEDNSLDKSSIQYMAEHDFIDHRLWDIYRSSCMKDFHSPRCKFFRMELQRIDEDQLNPYYVYEICKNAKSSEAGKLLQAMKKFNDKYKEKNEEGLKNLRQIKECPNDKGTIQYLNFAVHAFHVAESNKTWTPCSQLNYTIGEKGSMDEYNQIFLNKAIRVWMFNGDWDDVVPYRDSEKNLHILKREKEGQWEPWFYGQDKHHAGFYQKYDSLTLLTVKGAGHMVPQTQPKYAYQMFYNFINNRPLNTDVNQILPQEEIVVQ